MQSPPRRSLALQSVGDLSADFESPVVGPISQRSPTRGGALTPLPLPQPPVGSTSPSAQGVIR